MSTTAEIEAEAIRIHNESEAVEEKWWKALKRHKQWGPYPSRTWDEIKEGFYKERTRELAKKKLDAIIPRGRSRKVQPVQNVPKKQPKGKHTTR